MNDCAPSSGLVVDFPRAKGAVYVQHCTELFCTNDNENEVVTISGCDFIGNDAGPHIKSEYGDNAGSLYINGGMNTFITRTKFRDHKGSHDYYTTNVAPIYGKFYPTQYYTYANAPIIRIKISPIAGIEGGLKYNLTI